MANHLFICAYFEGVVYLKIRHGIVTGISSQISGKGEGSGLAAGFTNEF